MPCTHKFFQHPFHFQNHLGLFPNWKYKTLIIGTFNPENAFAQNNIANYFYGRSRHFWKALPQFPSNEPCDFIENENIESQKNFLIQNEIGLTDLLVRIDDADENNQNHINWIEGYQDNELQNFNVFQWNTDNIKNQIKENNIKAVYFTLLGTNGNVGINTFEHQMRLIEQYCNEQTIINHRLHSPTGMGLGNGIPQLNNLINRWYNQNGATNFPFLNPNFNLQNFPYNP